ncbi:MAG: hypothetical protein ACMXYL_05780, partial [Candidatus Woesearchaeota archaeon]
MNPPNSYNFILGQSPSWPSFVDCAYHGPASFTTSWGSREDCQSRCENPTSPQGVWNVIGSRGVQNACSGLSVPVNPGNPIAMGTVRFRSNIDTPARYSEYCDCEDPTIEFASTVELDSWYRDSSHSITVDWWDNYRIHSVEYRQDQSSDGGSSWSNVRTGTVEVTGHPRSSPWGSGISGNQAVPLLVGTGGCTISGSNTCMLGVIAVDYWDRRSEEAVYLFENINIDREAPTTQFEWLRTPDHTIGGSWYINSNKPGYRLTCNDPYSGCRAAETWNCQGGVASCINYTDLYPSGNPTSISYTGGRIQDCTLQRCTRNVRYRSYDNALPSPGNAEDIDDSENILLDAVPPSTTISPPTPPPHTGLVPGIHWVRGNFDYTISCTDTTGTLSGSGCASVDYSCTLLSSCPSAGNIGISGDTGSFQHTATCDSDDGCLFTMTRSGTDNVGNIETPRTQLYGIDNANPYFIGNYTYNPLLRRPSYDNWMNDSFTVTIEVRDDHSGIGSCRYRIIDGGTIGSWNPLTTGCPAGDARLAGPGVDDDRIRTITSPLITVGPAGDCSVEGRDRCEIEIEVFDMVGNSMSYSENVSIDYTPPECDIDMIIDYVNPYDTSPYSHYNHTERILYYNPSISDYNTDSYVQMVYPNMYEARVYYNVTILANDTNVDRGLSGDQVSGIYTITFPDITSGGGSYTIDDNYWYPANEATIWDSMHHYNYVDGATASGGYNVIVTDQAGNSNTCNITLIPDTDPPTDAEIDYDHYVDAAGLLEYDPEFRNLIGNDDLSLVRDAFIYVYYADGIELSSNQHTPGCGVFEDFNNLPGDMSDRYVARISGSDITADWNPIINESYSYRMQEGYCHKFFLRVYDNVNNYEDFVHPSDHIVAVDGTPDNMCTVFGRFDNCNNRASEWLNLNGTTRNSAIHECPGSCVGGTVYLEGTPYHNNAEVFVESFPQYLNISNSLGEYSLYNITENDRPHAFTANPAGVDTALYLPRTQTILLSPDRIGSLNLPQIYYPRDFSFAFDPRVCTDYCYAAADPFQICRSECVYTD